MGKLEGKIALVTGGNSGIGLATAKQFVGEGAHVFITGRREQELSAAAKDIGSNVTTVQGDVSKLDDLDRLFARIRPEKGRLDVLFANAGIAKYGRLGEISEEFFDSIFDINVKGVLFTVQKALPLMPDGAAIILNASVVGSKGLSSNSVYSATKAAIRSFARTWTHGSERETHSRQRDQPRDDRYSGTKRSPRFCRHGKGAREDDSNQHSTSPVREAGGNCQSCRVSGFRRRELHHGNRVVC